MNYIKYFDNKVTEGLENNDKYQEAKKTVERINGEIKNIREEFPLVFRESMTFDKLLFEARAFEQSYAERQDELDEYDYKINYNFFDKEVARNYRVAKESAIKYYDQLGVFIEKYPYNKLEGMQKELNKNSINMKAEEEKTVKRVIVEQISSPELTAFINDFIKGALPKELGQYGNKINKVISEEYNVMKDEDFKLRRQIQNEIQRVDNENEIF